MFSNLVIVTPNLPFAEYPWDTVYYFVPLVHCALLEANSLGFAVYRQLKNVHCAPGTLYAVMVSQSLDFPTSGVHGATQL